MRGLILDPVLIGGGVETIRLELLPRLAERFESLVWALPEGACEEFRRKTRGISGLKIVPLAWPKTEWRKWSRAVQKRVGSDVPRPEADLELASLLIDRFKPDFLLTTCVFDQPMPKSPLPIYGIVCDLNPVLPSATRANILEWVEGSAGTFAISEFTAEELKRALPSRCNTIHAVPLAARSVGNASRRKAGSADFRFLYPATANGHKEHLSVFAAGAKLLGDGTRLRIVLTGPGTDLLIGTQPMTDAKAEAARQYYRQHESTLGSCVIAHGSISEAELEGEYQAASAMLLPSSYEGFGLPLTEGLAWGLPVVCSDIAPFVEQLDRQESRDRAILFRSGSVEELAGAMRKMLRQPPLPLDEEELSRRLKLWTWADAAKRCAEAIEA